MCHQLAQIVRLLNLLKYFSIRIGNSTLTSNSCFLRVSEQHVAQGTVVSVVGALKGDRDGSMEILNGNGSKADVAIPCTSLCLDGSFS